LSVQEGGSDRVPSHRGRLVFEAIEDTAAFDATATRHRGASRPTHAWQTAFWQIAQMPTAGLLACV
jgi:hypothetical protein